MNNYFLDWSYKLDELAIIMIALISYIGICVISFAARYMKGDAKYRSFFCRLVLLIACVAIMVTSDNIWLMVLSACFSNMILVSLMIHKSEWKAAKASGLIAAKSYLLSAFFMASAFGLFYFSTGQMSIDAIVTYSHQSFLMQIGLLLLLLAAMAQSGIWPFHRWLISSLNSPTPVSAIMHAGLINGGGFFLARFATLYSQNETIMNLIFIFGMISALLGTLWKLMQSDVKRMLACSTMAQMGFMFAQCGLGLFPFAIAHLFWHGMFKAYLFLASGSAAQEKRVQLYYPPTAFAFMCALLCGVFASVIFAYVTHKSWFAGDSTLVLMMIVLLSGTQLALAILRIPDFKNFILASMVTLTAALVYGGSVECIIWILGPMKWMYPQPLNIFHIFGIVMLTIAWLCMLFIRSPWIKGYVTALNSGQPHRDTITAHRNHYQY